MTLWIIFALLLAAVLAAVLWPLLRPHPAPANRADYDIEVYLDQLRELERDASRDLIDESQAAAAKLEIERRLLAASRATGGVTRETSSARRGQLAALFAVAITAAALALYADLGSPGLPNQPFAQRPPAPAESPVVAQARSRLAAVEERLDAEPENPDIWSDLGSLRLAVGDEAGAVEALAQAMTLSGERSDIASTYGEVLTIAAAGMVTPEAQRVFQKVLSENAGEPRARFFIALASYQAGRHQAALEQWSALAKDSPPGVSWLPTLTERIRQTANEVGADAADYLPAQPGPTGDDVAAAANLSPAEQQDMIRTMVERLSSRLEGEPEDVVGWRQLGQSYVVLNERTRAAEAYTKALALEPNHAETLLRAALAAARAQDRAAALGYFERLRDLLAKDSDAYQKVSEAIERLNPPNSAD
jgi:cytochrome c-type biogenesis protein CcmH